ncbi:MAG: DUF475 domain-containing protein [Candidatus Omnitrophica bacterium]|nr:DUF475 domain-containing protein [Candidatus Omnitrophota bacterium]
MKYFKMSFIITVIGVILAFLWGLRIDLQTGLSYSLLALFLGVLEVSLSFDNAVINATKLELMPKIWQRRFLTWGILVAVFGMRLIFPIVLVSIFAGINLLETVKLALFDGLAYSHHLESCNNLISMFGGSFLLMIFLTFIFDKEKETHWLPGEKHYIKLINGWNLTWPLLIYMTILVTILNISPKNVQSILAFSSISGVALFIVIDKLSEFILKGEEKLIKHAGVVLFLYLELIDASFSFDGVIGAFALSKDIVLIAIGLGIGAMFVRSLTIYLVDKKTLKEFIYLEHGAHWAIGALAIIMFMDTFIKVPEVITGLIGVGFIGASLYSSIKHKQVA